MKNSKHQNSKKSRKKVEKLATINNVATVRNEEKQEDDIATKKKTSFVQGLWSELFDTSKNVIKQENEFNSQDTINSEDELKQKDTINSEDELKQKDAINSEDELKKKDEISSESELIKKDVIELETEAIPKFLYKRLVDKKLTIVLLENTTETVKERDMIIKIIKSLVPSGLITIINYGSTIMTNKNFESATLYDKDLLCLENIGEEACLYDALEELEKVVSEAYMKIEEKIIERVRISKIDVIGIGNCKEKGSKILKETAINHFYNVTKMRNITTKYYCFSENGFIDVAEIGFHSIGAIYRNYQQ